jgi:phosphatidylserine synthase
VLDARLRRQIAPATTRLAQPLAHAGIPAWAVTLAGLAVGLAACVAAGLGAWWWALGLWLANRALDGLDGAVARLCGPTDLGGYLDLMADLVVYAGFAAAVAVAVPDARLAVAFLLGAYYVNLGAWLALSSLAERRAITLGDERSLRFATGLAEGAETIVAYALIAVLPAHAGTIAWVFGALVALSAVQRVLLAARLLHRAGTDSGAGRGAAEGRRQTAAAGTSTPTTAPADGAPSTGTSASRVTPPASSASRTPPPV